MDSVLQKEEAFAFFPTETVEHILFFVPPRLELPLVLVCAHWRDILLRRRALRRANRWKTSRSLVWASPALLRWAKALGAGFVIGDHSIGERGRGKGELDRPAGIALHGDTLWVADSLNDRIQLFNRHTGECTGAIGKRGFRKGFLVWPTGITIAPIAGQVFVSQLSVHNITVLTLAGAFVRSFAEGGPGKGNPGQLCSPKGLCLSPDERELYVADSENSRIQVFSASDSTFLRLWEVRSDREGYKWQQAGPSDVKISAAGDEVFVCHNRISVFRPDGTVLRVIVHSTGELQGIALTSWGTLYAVKERQINERNIKTGAVVSCLECGSRQYRDRNWKMPLEFQGVVATEDGNVYMCDPTAGKVYIIF